MRRAGGRRLRIEHLEVRHVLDGGLVMLVDDVFDLRQNGPQITLDVLANDVFDSQYEGEQRITSASYGSEGGRIQIAPDGQAILYKPPADFFGTETFVYAVDGQHTAQVQVRIEAPLEFDHYEIPPDGQERVLDVLANDPFWPDYEGPRRITAVSVASAGGSVAIASDGKSLLYTPPDGAFGKDAFIYIVDDIYPAQVTVAIPRTLKDDVFEIIQHAQVQTFDVLANDPFWPGYTGDRLITHVTVPSSGGTVEIAPDGQSIFYTPGESAVGWDSFRYVVDGTYEANVSVRIHRPVKDDWFEVDQNSNDFYFNVWLNDTYIDLNKMVRRVVDEVTAVTQPESGGAVTIAADGKGILYTPPPGFTGADTFTYFADEVHEATVYVQVTRPVRDDHFATGVYQDTPDAVLHVLANDFIGNGYDGPRLITAVGPTENGGLVTIRSDGKALRYTPPPGYTGPDRFTYTVDGDLEATVTLNVRALAQPDFFQRGPDPSHRPYILDVLANDHFHRGYAGPGIITGVTLVSGEGAVSIQNGRAIVFDPDRSGSHTIRYTVDNQYEANVTVSIASHLKPDLFVVNQNSPAEQFDVLANDFQPDPPHVQFKSQDYTGPRLVTGAAQSKHGGIVTVAVDGRSIFYQPPEDFYGQDTFTYTVDDFMVASVTVQVIRRVRDDQFRVDPDSGPRELAVLANDLLGADYAGPGQITAVTDPAAGGTVTIAPGGRSVVYTPPAGFIGTDTFTYTVDDALKASVSIVVGEGSDKHSTFDSLEAFTQFLIDDALMRYAHLFGQPAWDFRLDGPTTFNADSGSRSHSETNVQVAGVDEGDIVEFDADYVYMLTDDDVVILHAWPAEELAIASRIPIEGRPLVEYLHGDRLTVISEVGGFSGPPWLMDNSFGLVGLPWWPPEPALPFQTIVTLLDVSDRTEPTIVQTTTMDGRYVDSRGVGDYVYVLVENPDAVGPQPQIIHENDDDFFAPGRYETQEEYLTRVTANSGEFVEAALPNYTAYGPDGELVRTGLMVAPEGIHQPLVPEARNLISVLSFDVQGDGPGMADTAAVYSTGASTIYASLDNFYVFDRDHSPEDGALTRIVKFDWDPATGGVEFVATTAVPGTMLNQFSADELGSHLRIATTISNAHSGNWSGRSENVLFVLEENGGVFEVVGSLQNLALGDTIRSVRFMGDRAFVTTFRDVDPLFAIDLSDPSRPEAVGHVTLPGFTSYVHLVDADYLLTVGRNTPVGLAGPTQVSLFDISDLAQPLRIAEYTFERFSTSEAELDHHAFGYFAEHGLLGMPVSRVYVERVDLTGDGYHETRQTVREDYLAVFTVDVTASEPDQRLALAGQIDHGSPVRRSGYIGDKLYSIAQDSVKVVDVTAPNDVIAEVVVGSSEPVPPSPPLSIEAGAGSGESTTLLAAPSSLPLASAESRLSEVINGVRGHLAAHLGSEAGAPLLVTLEAAPEAPGGGYLLVFRDGDVHYLYRANDAGLVELLQSNYEFATGQRTAWHAIEVAFPPPPDAIAGDYNGDGRVDEADRATWKASFGASSLTEFLPADGNANGIVDAADYVRWRDNLGAGADHHHHDATSAAASQVLVAELGSAAGAEPLLLENEDEFEPGAALSAEISDAALAEVQPSGLGAGSSDLGASSKRLPFAPAPAYSVLPAPRPWLSQTLLRDQLLLLARDNLWDDNGHAEPIAEDFAADSPAATQGTGREDAVDAALAMPWNDARPGLWDRSAEVARRGR